MATRMNVVYTIAICGLMSILALLGLIALIAKRPVGVLLGAAARPFRTLHPPGTDETIKSAIHSAQPGCLRSGCSDRRRRIEEVIWGNHIIEIESPGKDSPEY